MIWSCCDVIRFIRFYNVNKGVRCWQRKNPLVYIYQKNYLVSIRYRFIVKVVKAGKVVLPHPVHNQSTSTDVTAAYLKVIWIFHQLFMTKMYCSTKYLKFLRPFKFGDRSDVAWWAAILIFYPHYIIFTFQVQRSLPAGEELCLGRTMMWPDYN